MPQSIPRGLTRAHILSAIADLDASAASASRFGVPTKFELVHEGKRYAPKAAIGLACAYLTGTVLDPQQFSGGEAPGHANYVLRRLGFAVVAKGEAVDTAEPQTGKDWTPAEVALAVADYFSMLRAELLAQPYSKAEHRRALQPLLQGRSDSSIEFKHQNISAVLVAMGLPYIAGYKPRSNYQGLLAQTVEAFLDENPTYLGALVDAPVIAPDKLPATIANLDDVFDGPPDFISFPTLGRPWEARKPRRIDFVEKDANNRKLGKLGEEFVIEIERLRLRDVGREDLARKVDWVSTTVSDGLGYDILSFDEADDSERLVEVKTTGQGKFFPFYLTACELRCSEAMAARFYLYRVFDFSRSARVYTLNGSLRVACKLEPVLYLAGPDA